MQKFKAVEIEGRDNITAKELTIEQIKNILDGAENSNEEKLPPGILDVLFNEGISGHAVALSCNIPLTELESSWAPSELEVLRADAAEVNPTFLALWERLTNLGTKLIEIENATAAAKKIKQLN